MWCWCEVNWQLIEWASWSLAFRARPRMLFALSFVTDPFQSPDRMWQSCKLTFILGKRWFRSFDNALLWFVKISFHKWPIQKERSWAPSRPCANSYPWNWVFLTGMEVPYRRKRRGKLANYLPRSPWHFVIIGPFAMGQLFREIGKTKLSSKHKTMLKLNSALGELSGRLWVLF